MANGIDKELADAIRQAKSGHVQQFALVIKGGRDGVLMMGKAKISNDAIAAAKKKSGGSALILGTCALKDGVLIFETEKPPQANWAGVVKTLAKRDAGLDIAPVFKLLGATLPPLPPQKPPAPGPGSAPNQQGGPSEEEPKSEGTPSSGKDFALKTFKDRLKGMLPSLQKIIKANPDAKANFDSLRVEAQTAAQKGNMEDMLSALDALDHDIQEGWKYVRDAKVDTLPENDEKEKRRQFNDVVRETQNDFKTVLTLKPKNGLEMKRLLQTALTLAEPGHDIDRAWEKLRELNDMLDEAIFAEDEKADLPAEAIATFLKEYDRRLDEWMPDIQKALALKPHNAREIQKLVDEAAALAKNEKKLRVALAKLRQSVSLAWNVINSRDIADREVPEPSQPETAKSEQPGST